MEIADISQLPVVTLLTTYDLPALTYADVIPEDQIIYLIGTSFNSSQAQTYHPQISPIGYDPSYTPYCTVNNILCFQRWSQSSDTTYYHWNLGISAGDILHELFNGENTQ